MKPESCIDPGCIYVMIDPAIKDMVKIGRLSRSPDTAASKEPPGGKESTLILAYEAYCTYCSAAEKYVGAYLKSSGFKPAEKDGYYYAPLDQAIRTVLEAERFFGARNPFKAQIEKKEDNSPSPPTDKHFWKTILDQGDSAYYGIQGSERSYERALSLYKNAALLGSVEARERLAKMYRRGEGCQLDVERAIKWLKGGTYDNWGYCYAALAELYAEEGLVQKANECWGNFFTSEAFGASEPMAFKEQVYLSQVKSGNLPFTLREAILGARNTAMARAMKPGSNVQSGEGGELSPAFYSLLEFFQEIERL